jgi:hypothetical protein
LVGLNLCERLEILADDGLERGRKQGQLWLEAGLEPVTQADSSLKLLLTGSGGASGAGTGEGREVEGRKGGLKRGGGVGEPAAS